MSTTIPTGNADKLLADASKALSEGANIEAIRAAHMADVVKIGALAADGVLSLTDLAVKFAGWVKSKVFTEEHAGVIYTAYVDGFNAKIDAATLGGAGERIVPSKQSISIFKTFGREAVALYGDTWFGRVAKIAADVNAKLGADEKRLSVYNSLVRANRKLADGWDQGQKSHKDFAGWAKADVTDAAITDWIAPKAQDPKSDLLVLTQAVAALVKAGKREGLHADLAAHVAAECAKLESILDRAKAGTLKPLSNLIKAGPKLTPAEIKAQIEAA